MSIGSITHYDFLITVNHVKDRMIIPSYARFKYKDPNHKIVSMLILFYDNIIGTETPIFHPIEKDNTMEN